MIFTSIKAPLIICALVLVALGLSGAAFASGAVTAQPALYFLNIGQGDSELIELPGGVHILIDGGPSGRALLENLGKVLPPQLRYIDLLIMTHPQLDHFGGFIDLLKQYHVGAFIGNERKGPIAAYDELRAALVSSSIPYLQLMAGDAIVVGDSKLHIIGPKRSTITSEELNDTCEVVFLETPTITGLYTGDIGENIERELVAEYGKGLHADILKVGHHGSRFSSSDQFLKAINPAVAVIEVGKNTYGHPTKQAIDRLLDAGARVLRTDQEGIIKIVGAKEKVIVLHYT
jgi:competence protein ComEC